ncbi:MAG: hypothetical protein H6661_05295 [Ardenticatenaceae bacterium]|nr:hypothetical protein [Ardenticatenaceae bacterium]
MNTVARGDVASVTLGTGDVPLAVAQIADGGLMVSGLNRLKKRFVGNRAVVSAGDTVFGRTRDAIFFAVFFSPFDPQVRFFSTGDVDAESDDCAIFW